MRKLVISISVLAGLLLAGAGPASANAAAGLTTMQVQVDKSPGLVTKARWRHGGHHRGWRHHRRWGRGIYFGFGSPYYYGYYPRHHRWGHRGWGHRGWGHGGWGGRHHGGGHGGHRGGHGGGHGGHGGGHH
ncbi:VrrB protein [Hyphomicrobium sp.]|uniref:VrrB protein n=1 Tax=Hyphomicrobium sp. TaxID=82 RepID=UPI001DB79693|nr:VrrB protein [Hyphomicrobium sp.]MBY0559974.1 VrrB protein [Hyphomicrobium sp.]